MNQMTKRILLFSLAASILLGCEVFSIPLGSPPTPEASPAINNPATSQLPGSVAPTSTPMMATLPAQPSRSAPTLSLPTSTSPEKGGQTALIPQAVILVAEDDVLNVRQQPGAQAEIIAELPYDATGITLTGAESMVGDQRWVEILIPNGTGWVNTSFLTEYKTPTEFCSDSQLQILVENFKEAVLNRDGNGLAALVSPAHGIYVNEYHTGNRVQFLPEEVKSLFESQVPVNWGTQPASGMEVTATFKDEVLPKLDEVLSSVYKTACNDPAMGPNNYLFTWPADYKNVNYVSLAKPGSQDVELDWRNWLVGVEYVEGKPYVFALMQLFWEP